PVTVNLPTWTCQRIPVVSAPPANRLMRLVELTVRAVMGRGGDRARWRGRGDHVAVAGERGGQLDAYFQVDLIVPVDRDMPACTWNLLGADDTPHRAASFWYDPGQFLYGRATAHHGKRMPRVLFESYDVFHADHLASE